MNGEEAQQIQILLSLREEALRMKMVVVKGQETFNEPNINNLAAIASRARVPMGLIRCRHNSEFALPSCCVINGTVYTFLEIRRLKAGYLRLTTK